MSDAVTSHDRPTVAPAADRAASEARDPGSRASDTIPVSVMLRRGPRRLYGQPWRDPAAPYDAAPFAADGSKARDTYLRALLDRTQAGPTGAGLRASDAAQWARGVGDRDPARAADGRRRGKTLRADLARQASIAEASAGSLPSEAYGVSRFSDGAARGVRLNARDGALASRHGSDRKSDGARPIPRDHFAAPIAMLAPGARIVHVDPIAVGPMGHVRGESRGEARANDRAYLDTLVSIAPTVQAIDLPACVRIARGLLALRASGLACAETRVFAALGHGARKRIGGLLAQAK